MLKIAHSDDLKDKCFFLKEDSIQSLYHLDALLIDPKTGYS